MRLAIPSSIATAFNPTDETVQIGRECGPSFDVLVKMPDGSEIAVLREWNPGGAYTCQLGSWHFADPGELERLDLPWRVPLTLGGYEAVVVLRRPESMRSAPQRFTIQ